jgi:2-oxoglutarate ferredoxin oxidoreductase subunit beta
MTFGKAHDKGLQFDAMATKVVEAAQASTWDPTIQTAGPAFLLSEMDHEPGKPRAIGVFRDVQAPVFDQAVNAQVRSAIEKRGRGKFEDLVYAGEMWDVK